MKKLILFLGIVGIMLIPNQASAQEKLIIADFDSGRRPNNVGGDFINIEPHIKDFTTWCFYAFSSSVRHGDKGYSIRLDYDVDSPKPIARFFGMSLNNIDLSKYNKLVFWIKGDERKGFTKVFKVELKNNKGEVGKYYVTGVTEKWQEVVIPFNKFAGITDFSSMKEFDIVFESRVATEKEGTIYIDDIYVE